ncbi:type IV toxin-antitoxin system AbiEi family antitoxin domain-containing protein [Nocardioides sp. Bht2]|uniref:type IV toxin-antitoxin system AbiEi family antitoxin domain-containing protein n=1 Tax=Nocardioides sp. Bht2 TaxID=3392297 RepID=UPI0039B5C221
MELPHDLLRRQDGVVGRDQLLEAGLTDNDLRRLLRRRDLNVVHPGVYLNHTGEPTSQQRAWAALRLLWPAALSHSSALGDLLAATPSSAQTPLHVAVDRHRHLHAPRGVVLHHRVDLVDHVLWNLSPPRVRLEDAVIDVAS